MNLEKCSVCILEATLIICMYLLQIKYPKICKKNFKHRNFYRFHNISVVSDYYVIYLHMICIKKPRGAFFNMQRPPAQTDGPCLKEILSAQA